MCTTFHRWHFVFNIRSLSLCLPVLFYFFLVFLEPCPGQGRSWDELEAVWAAGAAFKMKYGRHFCGWDKCGAVCLLFAFLLLLRLILLLLAYLLDLAISSCSANSQSLLRSHGYLFYRFDSWIFARHAKIITHSAKSLTEKQIPPKISFIIENDVVYIEFWRLVKAGFWWRESI